MINTSYFNFDFNTRGEGCIFHSKLYFDNRRPKPKLKLKLVGFILAFIWAKVCFWYLFSYISASESPIFENIVYNPHNNNWIIFKDWTLRIWDISNKISAKFCLSTLYFTWEFLLRFQLCCAHQIPCLHAHKILTRTNLCEG